MRLFGRGGNNLTREQLLRSRPVKNQAIRWEDLENGAIRITIPRSKTLRARLLSLIFFIPRERVMELDSLGSEMVRLFDGKRTVEQIARHLANTRKLNRREAEVALLRYLQVLVKRGIVGLAVPEKR